MVVPPTRHHSRPSWRPISTVEEVHGRAADEPGDELVGRPAVDLHRRADLLQLAALHDRHAVGEHHRLFLVVRDEDGGDAEVALQALDLGAGPDAEAGVKVGERFVHQEDGRIADDGTADGDALALATAELGGTSLEQWPQVQHLGRGLDLLADGRPVDPLLAQAEAHVVAHRHVRVERVVLEDHGDVALGRLQVGDIAVVEDDGPGTQPLETGDAGERRALAAAGGAKQRQEFAVGDVDVEAVDRGDVTVPLGQLLQRDASHP